MSGALSMISLLPNDETLPLVAAAALPMMNEAPTLMLELAPVADKPLPPLFVIDELDDVDSRRPSGPGCGDADEVTVECHVAQDCASKSCAALLRP